MSDAVTNVTNAIDAEIAAIEQDIVRNPDPRQKRLRHLHQVKDHYLNGTSADADLADFVKETAASLHHVSPIRHVGRKPDPRRLMAIAALKTFLRGKKEPVRTSVLHQHLVEQGLSLGGSDPTNNLSAMLYHASEEFRSHRRAGWTLIGEAVQ